MEIHKAIVAGAGKSGIASAGQLVRNGVDKVIIYDQNKEIDKDKLLQSFTTGKDRVSVVLGELTDSELEGTSIFVISPGIPTDADFVNRVREKNIPVWGEIELGFYFGHGSVAAITGTNGKTTTTSLVGGIFKAYRDDSLVLGNIGLPYTRFSDSASDDTLIALEVSSFQLETITDFRPHVSAILNLTPDHLNRHYTLDNYYNAKLRVAENQTMDDYIVLNYDDPETWDRAAAIKNTNHVWFSRKEKLDRGVYLDDNEVVINDGTKELRVLDIRNIQILGAHNQENVLAAVAIAHYMGIPTAVIREAVLGFKGVEHRIEFVRELDGVKYYNDSKGTNPDAAIKALKAMTGPAILIAGGYDKKSEYDEWAECFPGKVKLLVLIGETADDIEKCAKSHGFNQIIHADTLEEAANLSRDHSRPGDSVLLSPACASWDMFKNYEERGELFKKYVNKF